MNFLDKIGINGKFITAGFTASIFSFIVGINAINAYDHFTNQLELHNQNNTIFQNYSTTFYVDTLEMINLAMATSIPGQTKEQSNEKLILLENLIKKSSNPDTKFSDTSLSPEQLALLKSLKEILTNTVKTISDLKYSESLAKKDSSQAVYLSTLSDITKEIILQKEKTKALAVKQNNSFIQSLLDYKSQATKIIWLILLIATIGCLGMGWLFAKFLGDALVALSGKLKNNSTELALTARQLTESGATLATITSEQAAALQETVTAIEQISALLNRTAENSHNSQKISEQSHKSAERGKEGVAEVMNAMSAIKISSTEIIAAIEASNQKMSDITKVIFHIGEKTKVINDIVFQTKLLSFNAAVEAARAGEQGKGFSVVAEEVGNLARMSGQAAKEISDMLTDSISQVENIVNDSKNQVNGLISDTKNKIETGTRLAESCTMILDEIVSDVFSAKNLSLEISNAIQEQSSGVTEISKAMNQLEQVTQKNSIESQKTLTVASDLESRAYEVSAAAMRLEGIVNFKLSETEEEKNANLKNYN